MNYAQHIRTSGGLTIDAAGNTPTSGYMVSIHGFERQIPNFSSMSDEDINEAIEQYRQDILLEENYFGAWVDNDTLYLDNSINTQFLETAIAYGDAQQQKSIYHINSGEVIFL
jgi:two-component SAPR family response regulator